jgi:hypothetical protein
LIFFSSCGDGLEGEDKCRFDFWVCGGWGGAMFGGLGVITETDNGADVRANVCSCRTLSPDYFELITNMSFLYNISLILLYMYVQLYLMYLK